MAERNLTTEDNLTKDKLYYRKSPAFFLNTPLKLVNISHFDSSFGQSVFVSSSLEIKYYV